MKFKLSCQKCGKIPTKRSVSQNDSWEHEYCPSCFGSISMQKSKELAVESMSDEGHIIRSVKMNPVDFYWSNLVNKVML